MSFSPKIVFSDFDGTLTHGSELVPLFFDILALLEKKQIELVIVTGRSRAWAHFLLTHFGPLQAVIAEGGGVLVTRHKEEPHERLLVPEIEVRRLEMLSDKLLKEFPGVPFSTDTSGRLTDRAISLQYLSDKPELKKEICHFLERENLNYTQSNVHLNFWAGDVDKYQAIEFFLSNYRSEVALDDSIFFGDSLNDESCFKSFKRSVGVSNISGVLSDLKFTPSTILKGKDKEGPYGVHSYLSELLNI